MIAFQWPVSIGVGCNDRNVKSPLGALEEENNIETHQ